MSKVSVIGGSGFIGTNLCKRFAKLGIDFEILDIKKSTIFPDKFKLADVKNIDSLRSNISGDIVVNLAAAHRDDIKDKNEYYKTNVLGAKNVVEICSEIGVKKIIFTSSVAVYGFAEPGTDEKGTIRPFNEYGRTKYEAEKVYEDWQYKNKSNLIIIRSTVVFGEGNRGNVYNLLNQISKGHFLMIGSGKNKKSLAYVGNIVFFIEKCLKKNVNHAIYNYVDTPDLDMNSLVALTLFKLKNKNNIRFRIPYFLGLLVGYFADFLSLIFNIRLPINSIRVKKFCASTSFSSSKLKKEGFKPPYSLSEGIERTINSEFISPDPNREIFYSE